MDQERSNLISVVIWTLLRILYHYAGSFIISRRQINQVLSIHQMAEPFLLIFEKV